ncbi:hypothetical protein AMTRI_Chr02g214290 [Amborella trichopoda]
MFWRRTRNFTAGIDLVRPGVTRFATSFLSLDSLNKQRDKLRTMLFCLDIFKPLVKVLPLIDSEREPTMGHVFKAMEMKKRYGPILKIVNDKWDLQFERPLHLTGYFLNPAYFYYDPKIEIRNSIMVGFNKCNVRLHLDSDIQDKVSIKLDLYRYTMGTLWTDIAVTHRPKIYPSSWWANHGQTAPNLQRMAQLILNLTCTSSGCEHNFSTFEVYNQRLKEQHLEQFQIEDPILVKDLDPTSEWLVEPNVGDESVFEGESLTWTQVQEVAGLASIPMRATRSQT